MIVTWISLCGVLLSLKLLAAEFVDHNPEKRNAFNFLATKKQFQKHNGNISKQCYEDFYTVFNTLKTDNNKSDEKPPTWADYMLDSYGGVSAGVSNGNFYWYGDFYECINSEQPIDKSDTNKSPIKGKYCLAFPVEKIVPEHSIKIGTCAPSSCSSSDLEIFFNRYGDFPDEIVMDGRFCYTKSQSNWDNVDGTTIGICCLIAFFALLVVIGTLVEIFVDSSNKPSKIKNCLELLLPFGAKSNVEHIASAKSGDGFSALHGMRAMSMAWVIVGHNVMMTANNMVWKNQIAFYTYAYKWQTNVTASAEYAVDTFLFISGFLCAFGFLQKLHKDGKFNYLILLTHRILRILPSYLFVLAFMSGPLSNFATGPISASLIIDRDACRQTWWLHALFINIYTEYNDKCLPQSWYLCLDMVYFALYPIIIYVVYKKPWMGYALFACTFIASIATPAIITYQGELEPLPGFMSNPDQRLDFIEKVYNMPWCRFSAGLVGLAFGYIVFYKDKLNMKLIFVLPIWVMATVLFFYLFYGSYHYILGDVKLSLGMKVFYGGFSRPLWSLVCGWIILACTTGYGSLMNSILSWKGFLPFSRLSYCMYLTHYTAIGIFYGNVKDPVYYDATMMTYICMYIFIISTFTAMLLNLLVESPFLKLEKILFKSK